MSHLTKEQNARIDQYCIECIQDDTTVGVTNDQKLLHLWDRFNAEAAAGSVQGTNRTGVEAARVAAARVRQDQAGDPQHFCGGSDGPERRQCGSPRAPPDGIE